MNNIQNDSTGKVDVEKMAQEYIRSLIQTKNKMQHANADKNGTYQQASVNLKLNYDILLGRFLFKDLPPIKTRSIRIFLCAPFTGRAAFFRVTYFSN